MISITKTTIKTTKVVVLKLICFIHLKYSRLLIIRQSVLFDKDSDDVTLRQYPTVKIFCVRQTLVKGGELPAPPDIMSR